MSLKLQRQLSKEEILEGYLNTIYFGRGAYGIQAASLAFFDKPAKDLTLREAAVLASVINNPSQFDPANGKDNKDALRERYEYVLAGMAAMGTADAAAAEKAAEAAAEVPRDRRREPVRRPARPHAQAGPRRAGDSSATASRRSTAAACGSPPPSPRRTWRPPSRASLEERPEGFDGGAAARRGGHRRAGHRRAARLLRAARTTSTPRSTGRSPAAWSARPSSPSR